MTAGRPPRRVVKRSSASRATYYLEGRRHLTRAVALHSDTHPFDALALMIEAPAEGTEPKLRPSTTRGYREDITVIVAVLVRASRRSGASWGPHSTMRRIETALEARRGWPTVARGASKRVKDASEEEARKIFVRLKEHALRDRTMTAAAAVYLLVEPRIGVRPIELCGARVEVKTLVLPNAKRADGQSERRVLDLRHLPDILVEAIRLLTLLAPEPGNPPVFERWRNSLASSLARASLVAAGRRLSLYSFRHVAISTWERAGFPAGEIAEMAGHLSLRTARTHYARAGSGWSIEGLPQPVAALKPDAVPHDALSIEDAELRADVDEEDTIPAPDASARPGKQHVTRPEPPAIAAWFERHTARIDELKHTLARARSGHAELAQQADQPDSPPVPRR